MQRPLPCTLWSVAQASVGLLVNLARLVWCVQSQTKLLGVDFSAGKKVKRNVQRRRIANIRCRMYRYRQIGARAARHILKTGAGPGFRYGAGVYGITDSAVKAVRSFSCNAIGEIRGRSTFARLTLAGYDAGGLMAIDPIVHWARAAWDQIATPDDMRVSWKAAMIEVARAGRPFAKVRGPAGAMVASAGRIGWSIPSPFHFLTGDGLLLSVLDISPRDIQLLAGRALMHKEASSSSLATRTGFAPDLEPLRSFLHSIRRTKAESSLRALGEGGWWTQDRMFAAGLPGAQDDQRKACNAGTGTLYHRCCGCPALACVMSMATRHRPILDMAQSALYCLDPLFQHGFPRLEAPVPPPPFVARWCGGRVVDDFQLTGDVFIDGSVLGGCRKGHERAGWAAVKVDGTGLVTGGIYGTCPDHFPTSLRAELWGVLQALRHAHLPIRLFVDNAGVVNGYARGRGWCCDSSRSACDLWRLIWSKVGDLGGEGVTILKVKGHATDADVEAGRSTVWHKNGNDHADHFAGRGSSLAEHLS